VEEHSTPVYKWRLLPDFWSTMGFIPKRHQFATLCRILHRQRLNFFTIVSSPKKFVECLYCDVSPPLILPVLSRFIESSVTYNLYIHTLIHSYINTFIYTHIHADTTSFIHGCISHPESCLVVSLQFGPHLSLCQTTSSTNEQLAIILLSSRVSPPMCLVKSCHPSVSSGKFQQTNNLNPFKSVILSVSGQEMSLINHF